VVENGTPVEFEDGEATQLERIAGGYVFVDGSGVGDIGPVVLRDRESLARDGFVIVVIRRDEEGKLYENPEIITRGFVYMKESEELIKQLSEKLATTLHEMDNGMSDQQVKDRATEAMSKLIYTETKRKPMTFAVVA
jgi:ribonuclease J